MPNTLSHPKTLVLLCTTFAFTTGGWTLATTFGQSFVAASTDLAGVTRTGSQSVTPTRLSAKDSGLSTSGCWSTTSQLADSNSCRSSGRITTRRSKEQSKASGRHGSAMGMHLSQRTLKRSALGGMVTEGDLAQSQTQDHLLSPLTANSHSPMRSRMPFMRPKVSTHCCLTPTTQVQMQTEVDAFNQSALANEGRPILRRMEGIGDEFLLTQQGGHNGEVAKDIAVSGMPSTPSPPPPPQTYPRWIRRLPFLSARSVTLLS